MSRKQSSQWEFGELFPPEQTRRVFSVSELTTTIRRLLEKEVGELWITGEVTNLRAQSSGHIYFTLKDASAQLNCVLFRNEPAGNREFLQDGQKVILQGTLTVYEPRGQYQLVVRTIEPQGIGALQLAFEKLKRKLHAEGLFDPARKRPLPRFPQRIGLVTSPTGAAIRDVLHVIQRRQPGLELVLAPCRVQGDGAAAEIAAAIRSLNALSLRAGDAVPLDLILVTRGGGSLEDLWAFNEEVVARAMFESAVPVVSAVGHEIDFTISDFVADLRAATPSAAAELITEGAHACRPFLAEVMRRLSQRLRSHIATRRDDLHASTQRLARAHPRRRWQEHVQHVDDLQVALLRATRQQLRAHDTAYRHLRQRLFRLKPSLLVQGRRDLLHEVAHRLREGTRHHLERHVQNVEQLAARLRLLSPDNVLSRGYSITTDAATGRVLRRADEAHPGQALTTRLHAGVLRSRVEASEAGSDPE